jgi:hypothetical protein
MKGSHNSLHSILVEHLRLAVHLLHQKLLELDSLAGESNQARPPFVDLRKQSKEQTDQLLLPYPH